MSLPTPAEVLARIDERLRQLQEDSATYAHLMRANDDHVRADGFLRASEQFKRMNHLLRDLATRHIV